MAVRLVGFAFLFSIVACSSDEPARMALDAGEHDAQAGSADATAALDATSESSDASQPDAQSDAASDAKGPSTMLVASFEVERIFDEAYFGKNKDGTLHLEVHGGANFDGCPVMESPTPARTLIIGSLEADVGSRERGAALLDHEAALTEEPVLRSTSGQFDLLDYAEDTSVSATVSFSFEGGSIAGWLEATYCASIDEIP